MSFEQQQFRNAPSYSQQPVGQAGTGQAAQQQPGQESQPHPQQSSIEQSRMQGPKTQQIESRQPPIQGGQRQGRQRQSQRWGGETSQQLPPSQQGAAWQTAQPQFQQYPDQRVVQPQFTGQQYPQPQFQQYPDQRVVQPQFTGQQLAQPQFQQYPDQRVVQPQFTGQQLAQPQFQYPNQRVLQPQYQQLPNQQFARSQLQAAQVPAQQFGQPRFQQGQQYPYAFGPIQRAQSQLAGIGGIEQPSMGAQQQFPQQSRPTAGLEQPVVGGPQQSAMGVTSQPTGGPVQQPGMSRFQTPGTGLAQRLPPRGITLPSLSVNDIIRTEVVTAEPDASVASVISDMADYNVGSVVIVEDEVPIGLLTDREIALALKSMPDLTDRMVREIVDETIVTGSMDMTLFEILDLMTSEGIRRIPIVDDAGRLQGIVSLDDLLLFFEQKLGQVSDIVKAQLPNV
jgi:CBS domain-containing protein